MKDIKDTKDEKDETTEEEGYKLVVRLGKYGVRRIDSYNIVVEEFRTIAKGDNIGSEYSVTVGYYKTLGKALGKMLQLEIEKSSISSLKDVQSALTQAETNLYKALDTSYKNFNEGK